MEAPNDTFSMKDAIVQYMTLIVTCYILARIVAATILVLDPSFLTIYRTDGSTTYDINYLISFITYVFNIGIAVVLYIDMKKQNNVSYIILLSNILSSYIGVMFYLILNYRRRTPKCNCYE